MNNKIYFPQQPIGPIKPGKSTPTAKTDIGQKSDFEQMLANKLEPIKFSHHAQERLKSRNIEFSASDMNKLTEAVVKAKQKGAKDSLILMNDLALVVSIKNNTVITAVDGQNLKENVFTNIDSAVIV